MGLLHILAGALALLTAVILLRPLLAGRRGTISRADADSRIYRDQLAEIDRDLERGTISAAEADSAKAEVSRRLIAAAARAEAEAQQPATRPGPSKAWGIALCICIPLAAGYLYFGSAPLLRSVGVDTRALSGLGSPQVRLRGTKIRPAAMLAFEGIGSPDLPDLPLAGRTPGGAVADTQRPSQDEAEAMVPPRDPASGAAGDEDYVALIARLEGILAKRPDDIDGQRLLAKGYMRLGRYAEAWRAYAELIRLLGDAAEPELYTSQLEAMIEATGGYISPEAERLLARTQRQSPKEPAVRYFSGLLKAQQGDVPGAIALWETLRAEMPADSPLAGFLDMMLAEARAAIGGSPGPSAAQVEAAGEMSPEERQAMVEGMVARLEQRLTTEGGTAEDWLRLINAYVKLDRPDDARRIYALAAAALGDGSEAALLRERARALGVIAQ